MTSRVHGPLLDKGTKATGPGAIASAMVAGFNSEYLVVVRDGRMVKRFYPKLTTAIEFDSKSDLYTEIDYAAKTYSTTSLADFVRVIDQTVYSPVLPPSVPRKSETSFVATREFRSTMGLAARKHTFETRIAIAVVSGAKVSPQKSLPPNVKAGSNLDATILVCGSSWLSAPLPGYERFQSYGRQHSQKMAAVSRAPFRAAFLEHGGLDVFEWVSSTAGLDDPGMLVDHSWTIRIILGSAAKCTGESLAEINASYVWFDEPESKEDPFSSPAILAKFSQVPSAVSFMINPPAAVDRLSEDENGRPTLRRPDTPEKDERPVLKRRKSATTPPRIKRD